MHKRTGALGLVRVLVLDHLHDAALVGDDPAVLQCVGRLEAEHDRGGGVVGVEPLDHRAHRLGADERDVAVEHQHVAVEAGERVPRLLHRVAGAQLRRLHRELRPAGELRFELLAQVADHDHGVRRRELGERGHQVLDHRPPGDRVEHLVAGALHPRALARGEDDSGEWSHGFPHATGLATIRLRFPYACPKAQGMADFPLRSSGSTSTARWSIRTAISPRRSTTRCSSPGARP